MSVMDRGDDKVNSGGGDDASGERQQLEAQVQEWRLPNLYVEPHGITDIHDMEASAQDRLSALTHFSHVDAEVEELPFLRLPWSARDEMDVVSHFTVRLAFCPGCHRELWEWWLFLETKLFTARFERMDHKHQAEWVLQHVPGARRVTTPEMRLASGRCAGVETSSGAEDSCDAMYDTSFEDDEALTEGANDGAFERFLGDGSDLIAVPWEWARWLVGSWNIILLKGSAIVRPGQLRHIAAEVCSQSIQTTRGAMERMRSLVSCRERDRLLVVLDGVVGIARQLKSQAEAVQMVPRGSLRLPNLDDALPRFPLCGRNLLMALRRVGHLKFDARKQLSLFLKGVGLPHNDAQQLFQTRFRKHPDPEIDAARYAKKKASYAATVAGLYGKGGLRKDYSPYSCDGILRLPPGHTVYQCHGCPYKRLGEPSLRQVLPGLGLSPVAIEEVVELAVRQDKPKQACAKAFEAVCSIAYPADAVTAPHEYFAHARAAL